MKDSKQVVLLNLDDILPNRFQPRIKFNEKSIVELSESIKEHGVIQPIIVRKISDKYEIIAGERRYKASVLAGKSDIPAIIVDMNDKDSSEIALIENVQREDLTPIEEAISYRKILDMGYLTQEALANKLGVAQSTIANKLRLLNLEDEVQEALLDGKISERHARSLLKLNSTLQNDMLKRIISERLTVRKTDEVIDNMLKNNSTNVFDSLNSENLAVINENNQMQVSAEENPFIMNVPDQQAVRPNVEVLDFGFEEIKAQPMSDLENESAIEIEQPQNSEGVAIQSYEEAVPVEQPHEEQYVAPTPVEQPYEEQYVAPAPVEQPYEEQYVAPAPVEQPYEEQYVAPAPVEQPYEEQYVAPAPVEQPYEEQYVAPAPVEQPYEEQYVAPAPVEQPYEEPAYENRFITMLAPEESVEDATNEIATSGDVFNQKVFSDTNIVVDEEPSAEITDSQTAEIAEEPVNDIFNSAPIYEDAIPEQQVPEEAAVDIAVPLEEENPNIAESTAAPYIVEEIPVVPATPAPVEQANLKDVINKMRKLADDIETMGYEIDTEEFDFDDIYQVIFKIKK